MVPFSGEASMDDIMSEIGGSYDNLQNALYEMRDSAYGGHVDFPTTNPRSIGEARGFSFIWGGWTIADSATWSPDPPVAGSNFSVDVTIVNYYRNSVGIGDETFYYNVDGIEETNVGTGNILKNGGLTNITLGPYLCPLNTPNTITVEGKFAAIANYRTISSREVSTP